MLLKLSVFTLVYSCSAVYAQNIDPSAWLNGKTDCKKITLGFEKRFNGNFDAEEYKHIVSFTCKKYSECSFNWCVGLEASNKAQKKPENEINQIDNEIVSLTETTPIIHNEIAQPARAGLADYKNLELKNEKKKDIIENYQKELLTKSNSNEDLNSIGGTNERKFILDGLKNVNSNFSAENILKEKIAQRSSNVQVESRKLPKSPNQNWMTFGLTNSQLNIASSYNSDENNGKNPTNLGSNQSVNQKVTHPASNNVDGFSKQEPSEKIKRLAEYQARTRKIH